MAIGHASITDPNLHEPKGISTAQAGQVYRANGDSLSGVWSATDYTLCDSIADGSTASSTSFVPVPQNAQMRTVYISIDTALTADQTMTFNIPAGPIPSFTINLTAAGSAPGDVFFGSPPSPVLLAAGEFLQAVSSGGSMDPVKLSVVYQMRPT